MTFAHFSRRALGPILPVVLTALVALFAAPAPAATSPEVSETERAVVRLVAEQAVVAPGDTLSVAVHQELAEGWHTYWVNGGDSGAPISITWTLPDGAEMGPTQWPAPHLMPFEPLMNYGYKGEVVLISDVQVPEDWPARTPFALSAAAQWLVCEQICVIEEATFTLSVATDDVSAPNRDATRIFAQGRASQPTPLAIDATYAVEEDGLTLTFAEPALASPGVENVYFFPTIWGVTNHAAAQTPSAAPEGLSLKLAAGDGDPPTGELPGVLRVVDASSGATVDRAYALTLRPAVEDGTGGGAFVAVGGAPTATGPGAGPASSPGAAGGGASGVDTSGTAQRAIAPAPVWGGFLGMVLFAILGGAILNLMPCVFPVLALKALKIAKHSDEGGAERLSQGLAYGAGVLVSFLAFAGALIALKAAGESVGWGFQLQTPIVVAALAYVLFAVGLNLSGVFEIPAGFAGAGSSLAAKPGTSGSFFTGVLAAVVASPCTAPFMGVALGYALTQSAAVTIAVFAALAVGFAAPVVALSASPRLAAALPKPGAWMVRFRQLLAFPMYAAAAWLLWVLGNQVGVDALFAAMIGLVLLALAAWSFGAGRPEAVWSRRAATAAGLVALLGAAAALQPSLGPIASNRGDAAVAASLEPGGPTPFSEAELARLRAEGRTVFLNVTADWCISCKVNERGVLASDGFQKTLEEADAVYMVGDWTVRDEEITRLLEGFGRAGVPLYVVFHGADRTPQVLPQILLPADLRAAILDSSA